MKLNNRIRGGETVEFALVAPLLFFVLFGIMEFGIIFYDLAIVTNTSRDLARYGVLVKNSKKTAEELTPLLEARMAELCNSLINFQSGVNCVLTLEKASIELDQPLNVLVTYNYHNAVFGRVFSLLTGGIFPNPLPLKSRTIMYNE